MDKPMTFNEWMGKQGNLALVHANCCRIAYEAGQQSQQAKVEELQTLYTQQGINMLKMQKRVDAALKLIESWNEIAFDKTTHWTEGYEEGCYHCAAQLEQALKGEG
ncbi:hypothetical protein BA71_01693 [Acinetobacter baumannii LAC-4]|uniref:hypothetical protein n=1 Tax=Acinetobacter baumannii TaxID=470 RepID=UPI00044D1D06|nr:hypothetical protein [Acinetobacter baumannii]AIY36514.1 hypothetical protein ABLAC_11590 [Acinetobacter baumannii LAC-4]APO59911.1 hypothetical protein BBX32_15900 [Acinetobacter baumannii]EZF15550.1 hypothetical protein BA71_01693 [Acinetobacter baumannii LAC-4]